MIQELVKRGEISKSVLELSIAAKEPDNYNDLVTRVITVIKDPLENDDNYPSLDATKIHEIDDGNYQGTLLYLIPEDCYQPSDCWYVKVDYGSCSGCDTLERIKMYGDEPPTAEQVKDYMTLALHILQGIHKLGEEEKE